MNQKLKILIPFIFLFTLLGILGKELFYATPNERPSVLVGKDVPRFELRNLFYPDRKFTQDDLKGKFSLLNVWATWCGACAIEHQTLMKLKENSNINIYGIVYKDSTTRAIEFLSERGNPFVMVGNDNTGDVAIEFGIFGTPETFLINSQGKIIYRHIGILDEKTWQEKIYPLVKKYA